MLISITELKANLSAILARAKSGEVFVVTSRNKPVARITGITPAVDQLSQKFWEDGSISWNGRKPVFSSDLITLSPTGKAISEIILDERA